MAAVAQGDQRRKKEAIEHLISDLAKGDEDNIINSIRVAIERGWIESFNENLTHALVKKENEINRICSRHYTNFLFVINNMMNMKNNMRELNTSIKQTQVNLTNTGSKLIHLMNSFDGLQLQRDNLNDTRNCIEFNKEILQLMIQINGQIEKNDHYNAMRSIEIIQNELNNILIQPLTKLLDSWIPNTINKLLTSVKIESDKFMEFFRSKINNIGQTIILRQTSISGISLQALIQDTELITSNNQFNIQLLKIFPTNLTLSLKNIFLYFSIFLINNKWTNSVNFNDFVPLYYALEVNTGNSSFLDNNISNMPLLHKTLYLYAILGDINDYYNNYIKIRQDFFYKLLKNYENSLVQSNSSILNVLIKFFESIIGFFFIECLISKMIEIKNVVVFSKEELERLWNYGVNYIKDVTINMMITLNNINDLIQLKEFILLVSHVISDEFFDFNPDSLINFIMALWESFEALQIQSLVYKLNNSLDYQPYFVTNYEDYQHNVKAFNLENVEIEINNFNIKPRRTKDEIESANNYEGSKLDLNLDALEESLGLSNNSASSNSSPMTNSNSPSKNISNIKLNPFNNKIGVSNFVQQTLPFSEFVPIILREFHAIIIRSSIFGIIKLPNKFTSNFDTNYGVLNDQLNEDNTKNISASDDINIEKVFCQSIFSSYNVVLKRLTNELNDKNNDVSLSKVTQIFIDSSILANYTEVYFNMIEEIIDYYFSSASEKDEYDEFGVLIQNASEGNLTKKGNLGTKKRPVDVIYKKVMKKFESIISEAQGLIFEILSEKITELFESLVFINFTPNPNDYPFKDTVSYLTISHVHSNMSTKSQVLNNFTINYGGSSYPNQYVHDTIESILSFLTNNFMFLTHLPSDIRHSVYCSCCRYISNGIIEYLGSKLTSINVLGLLALEIDCRKLIEFADGYSEVVELRDCFNELHELVRVPLYPDLGFLVDKPQEFRKVFPFTDPHRAATLIDKILPTPITLANLPRFEKNVMRVIVRKLKAY